MLIAMRLRAIAGDTSTSGTSVVGKPADSVCAQWGILDENFSARYFLPCAGKIINRSLALR